MEIQEQLNRLTGIVESLAASVVHRDDKLGTQDARIEGLIRVAVKQDQGIAKPDERIGRFFDAVTAHNEQIGLLIQIADRHKEELAELRRSMAETDRLFQAYLKRLLPQ
jgi:hypothetical protein